MGSDWKFGDVLQHENETRIVFLLRQHPVVFNPDGSLRFWGFVGLYLAPRAFEGVICGFGGHPDVRFNAWRMVESAQEEGR